MINDHTQNTQEVYSGAENYALISYEPD